MMQINPKTYNGYAINNGTVYSAIFEDGAHVLNMAQAQAVTIARPGAFPLYAGKKLSGKTFGLRVVSKGASFSTALDSLQQYFDTSDDTLHQLVITDENASDWYLNCTPVANPVVDYNEFQITLHASDPIWRKVTAGTASWSGTATGGTVTVTNGGNYYALPTFKIKPTATKTGGFQYKRFITVRNSTSETLTSYPIDICNDGFDTATLVSASKMQADGDDLRVYVDGIEVNRWLDGINTSTTKVWCNLNYSGKIEGALSADIAASGTIASISAAIATEFASKLLLIDSELFTYSASTYTGSTRTYTGITRAAKGTSEAAHTAGTIVYAIEHDIWIYYGDSALAAPASADAYKPMFELDHSTNGTLVYENFRDTANPNRPGQWTYYTTQGAGWTPVEIYTGNQGSAANPASEIGISVEYRADIASATWVSPFLPLKFTDAQFTNGEKRVDTLAIKGSWYLFSSNNQTTVVEAHVISECSTASVWQAWSYTGGWTTGGNYVCFRNTSGADTYNRYFEVSDVSLTLTAANLPAITIGAEAAIYPLAATITNSTTGESLSVSFGMTTDEQLQIDTDAKTVTYLADNSNAFSALSLSTVRREWLRLQPGANVIKYEETGMNGVTLDIEWEDRHL